MLSGAHETLKSETMRFTQHASSMAASPTNPLEPTFMLADTSDRVEGFFSRPLLIQSYEWAPDVGFHETFNPWSDFFDNIKIQQRLSNFAWLRCKLKLRILVNSTPFYYGRLMAAYRPMHQNDNITQFRPGVQADFVEASQRPCVILNPAQNEIGEMTLPFMYPKSAVSIPAKEWDRLGEITLADLTVLKNCNNSTDSVTVSVFAWAEEVVYSQPTSHIYTAQGEYYDGPVSKPAHTIARFANHLAKVPIIGAYAKATDMAMSTTAAIAKLFGFSRPTVVVPHQPYINTWGKQLAATNVEDTADPLSLDIKKEVTIDPRVVGCGPEDQMAFVPLAKRETWIAAFPWTPNQANGSFLFNIHASPTQRVYEDPLTVHTTPAAWISSLFRTWRGTMKIRFEVVASPYHKGQLRLVYDPITQVTTEYNVNYTHVMDLQSETDYTMEIGWAQNVPYLVIDHLNSENESHSEAPFANHLGNGVVSVFVVNSLTQPSEQPSEVYVNVYVSMCDDFEVADPTGTGLEDLSITEGTILPAPIIPADPPGTPPGNQPIRGRLASSSIFNQVPNSLKSIPPGVAQAPSGAIVIRSLIDTQVYQGPGNVLLTGLKSGPNEVEINFRAVGPPGGSPDLLIDGDPMPWVEQETGLYVGQYTLNIDQPGPSISINLDWQGGTGILIIDSLTADRATNTGWFPAGSLTYSAPEGDTFLTEDQYGPYYEVPPGEQVTFTNPGVTVQEHYTSADIGVNLNVNNVAIPTAGTPHPSRNLTGNSVSDTMITVINPSNTTIKYYGFTAVRPLFVAQGATEEKVQPEHSEIIENAAGVAENLPALSAVFYGEVASSFRQIMRRYTLARRLLASGPTRYLLFANPRYQAYGQVKASDVSLWAWVTTPYLGWKGSVRVKAFSEESTAGICTISRLPEGLIQEQEASYGENSYTPISWAGSTRGDMRFNSPEAVIPWYSNMRFRNARIGNPDTTYERAPAFRVDTTKSQDATWQLAMAIGEDFGLYYWVSTPIVTINV